MFITHQSNRLENLFQKLVETVSQPLANVFTPETIIVQSQGMARWLSLELAKNLSISANLDCPFPASFIWRLFQKFDGDLQTIPVSAFDPESLVWTVMDKIGEFRSDSDFSLIHGFLEVGDSDLRLYQLAAKISLLFDQYLMYRPDWIMAWSEGRLVENLGPGQLWQAKLWRSIITKHGEDWHRAALFERFTAACDDRLLGDIGYERLCLFGIPSLSQLHLDVFVHLSRFIDVHLFLLTPCAEFTDDLIDVRQLERLRLQTGTDSAARQYYELGCPLLMSLGSMWLDFAALLNRYDLLGSLPDELYTVPEIDSVLSLVHSDLLRGTEGASAGNVQLPETDHSIQLHSAHSPMREVEILHDWLLDLLNNHDDLLPADIIVMMPDITLYAPLIEAVFSSPHTPEIRIPYSIADQCGTDPIVLAFMELLQVSSSRFSASDLLALLDQETIRQRYELSSDDLLLIKHWVAVVGIRWGLETGQQVTGTPEDAVGTWQYGLDRLMLGFTVPGDCVDVFEGVLPCDAVEGGAGVVLGRLLSFFEDLKKLSLCCAKPKNVNEWRAELGSVLATFFSDSEENYWGLQKIRSALEDLESSYEAAKVNSAVSIKVMISVLEKKIVVSRDHHFLSGRVTFCQMVPMRSIPFRVICLLGMSDTAFPRQDKPLGFDLRKGNLRQGDRCRRDDDRYLFLEILLSVRQFLYISYVGQNDTDYREIPPSTVVSELLEYLGRRLGLDDEACRDRFLSRHALQPFSRRYFSGELSSYSTLSRDIAESLIEEKVIAGLFIDHGKRETETISRIELSDLLRFFHHPVKYLLNKQYELYLDDKHDQIVDRSCFMLDALGQYQLSLDLVTAGLQDRPESPGLRRYQLAGALPKGCSGSYFYELSRECAKEVRVQFEKFKPGLDQNPLAFELECENVRLSGTLDGMTDSGQFLFRPAYERSVGYKDIITTWIRHLVMSAVLPEGSTTFICRDGGRRFEHYTGAQEALSTLLALYCEGLTRPLPLFPKSTYAYAKCVWGPKGSTESAEKGEREAKKSWFAGSYFADPEYMDPYLYAVYQGRDPFTDSGSYNFQSVAQKALSVPLSIGEKLS